MIVEGLEVQVEACPAGFAAYFDLGGLHNGVVAATRPEVIAAVRDYIQEHIRSGGDPPILAEQIKKHSEFMSADHVGYMTLSEIAEHSRIYIDSLSAVFRALPEDVRRSFWGNGTRDSCLGAVAALVQQRDAALDELGELRMNSVNSLEQMRRSLHAAECENKNTHRALEAAWAHNQALIAQYDPARALRAAKEEAAALDHMRECTPSTIAGARNDWAPEKRQVQMDEQHGEEFER